MQTPFEVMNKYYYSAKKLPQILRTDISRWELQKLTEMKISIEY